MMDRQRLSLKTKLTVFATLLVVFVATSLSTIIRTGQKKAITEREAETRNEAVHRLRRVVRDALVMDDETAILNYMDVLKESERVAYAMILDSDGVIQVHTDLRMKGTALHDKATTQALSYRVSNTPLTQFATQDGRDLIDLSLPVVIGSPEVFYGIVRIGFDKTVVDRMIAESMREVDAQIFKAFVLALVLGLLGALSLAFFITKPIETLRQGAKLIGEGKLDHRIQVATRDELRDLAEEFNLMGTKLAELDQMKQDFVSNVTHELRSPMTSIRGYIDLLLKGVAGPLAELQKDYLSIIKNSAVRLGRFIDNLLDVAKIEAHKLKLTPEIQDLTELAHEMEVLFKPQLEEKKIAFHNDVTSSLPKVFVDKDKLAEVLINLTSNAIKFTPEQGIIRIQAKEGSNHLEVILEDSGVGIPTEMIGKIFSKFEQVKRTQGLARNQKGTGLGLTIVKGIIEAHGGKIWAESPGPSGVGTAFHFTIPKLTEELKAKLSTSH